MAKGKKRSTGRTPKKKRKNSKDKGQRGEREVARLVGEWWGADFARTPMSGGFRTKKFREDWNAEADLVTPDEDFPFAVEVKWHEGWTLDKLLTAPKTEIWEWWQQALGQTSEGKIALLVFRRNHMPWYYMIESKHAHHIPGRFVVTSDPQNRSVTVGLLSDLFVTDKELWMSSKPGM